MPSRHNGHEQIPRFTTNRSTVNKKPKTLINIRPSFLIPGRYKQPEHEEKYQNPDAELPTLELNQLADVF